MAAITKDDLLQQIRDLQQRISKLKEKQITKCASSAASAALTFLAENVEDITAIDMDTSYGKVEFKLKR